MKTLEQLKEARQNLTPRQQGIYFLFDGEELVYVGISTDVTTRVNTHRNNPDKRFDSYSWYPVQDLEELARLETDYIFKYTPKYNGVMPSNGRYLSKAKLKEILEIDGHALNRYLRLNKITPNPWGYYDLYTLPLKEITREQ